MASSDLADNFQEFREDLLREAEITGDPQYSAFFSLYSSLAAGNGDCPDLTYVPVRSTGRTGFQVDGYAVDPERGELHLAICDFRPEGELQSLNASGIEALCNRVRRFCEKAADPDYVRELEESSPAYEVAMQVLQYLDQIDRIRAVIFSNARIATRKKYLEAGTVLNKPIVYNVFDFSRYVQVQNSLGSFEPIELEIDELHGAVLPCLEAHVGESSYRSYLVVMPGSLLAEIYGLYGARLMEQNVRTFLQARTKVNRGIIRTIEESPDRFFAYNNGITATATSVSFSESANGMAIRRLSDLQIVNGGQTTASLLYARDRNHCDLSRVFVQMKLSVIDPDQVDEVVPLISRYANTQNRISEADFFSSHPFHLEMQQMSRRITAPAREGSLSGTRWFYERARGQYRNEKASGTPGAQRRFVAEYPNDQVLQKTDLSKYEFTFGCQPHVVSLGAQKCFLEYAEGIGRKWETNKAQFNDRYFKDAVAKAIVFRWTDRMIGTSDWYRADRGYKANIVTYSVAWVVNFVRKNWRSDLNLELVWQIQDVPPELKGVLQEIAPEVASALKQPPPNIVNISEYAKRQGCWDRIADLNLDVDPRLRRVIVDVSEVRVQKKTAQQEKRLDYKLEFEILIYRIAGSAAQIRKDAIKLHLLSPRSEQALNKLISGHLTLSKTDTNALKTLFERLDQAGEPVERYVEGS